MSIAYGPHYIIAKRLDESVQVYHEVLSACGGILTAHISLGEAMSHGWRCVVNVGTKTKDGTTGQTGLIKTFASIIHQKKHAEQHLFGYDLFGVRRLARQWVRVLLGQIPASS